MNRKVKVTSKTPSESNKNDKNSQIKKSQQKPQSELDEHLEELRELNQDLVEIIRNIKQTQSQLSQLEETNGKFKQQKMATAQNNLKNLRKRQSKVEKEVKGVLGSVRKLREKVDLEDVCKELPGVMKVVIATSKKKTEDEKVATKTIKKTDENVKTDKKIRNEEKMGIRENTETDRDPVKNEKNLEPPEPRSYSLFGESPYVGPTYSRPPHFSQFNNSPGKVANFPTIETLKSKIEALKLRTRQIVPQEIHQRFHMPSYRSNIAQSEPNLQNRESNLLNRQPNYQNPRSNLHSYRQSCLVRNENGIYTLRKPIGYHQGYNIHQNNPQSYYSNNFNYESASQNRLPPRPNFDNSFQIRDRDIDPFGCWKPPSLNSKPQGF